MADTSEKESTDRLLPWYINNTLSPEERDRVSAYLNAGGEEAKAELQLMQKIAEQTRQSSSIASPGELGWKRLQRQIHEEAKQQLPKQQSSTPQWYRPALAAALAVIVVQGSFMLGNGGNPDGDLYQPLSSTQVQAPLLQVKFAPTTNAQQIAETLRAAKVTIVDGPSAAGIYRLRATSVTPEATQAAALVLETQTDIITHVTVE